jgi:hypothetical protein
LKFSSRMFYYVQERYLASKQYLCFYITVAVCLHLVNCGYVVSLSVCHWKYGEMKWEGRKIKYYLSNLK